MVPSAKLKDVRAALARGESLQFVHATCTPWLVDCAGQRRLVDGRSYQGFLRNCKTPRQDVGSLEAGDLVIVWNQFKKM